VTTYDGTVTVTVVERTGVAGSPHPIDMTLNVVGGPIYDFFLPMILRGYRP
jgi:hypothetical protein